MKYTIDAKNKKVGRIASQAAALLMGKNLTTFSKNVVPQVEVHITNVAGLDINPNKASYTKHARHSGYPGGIKVRTTKNIIEHKGTKEVVRKAVYGMLPTNKLRSKMIRNLIITE
jgi:large subunit ribosomal protein L13